MGAGRLGTQGPEGVPTSLLYTPNTPTPYRWHKGIFGVPGGVGAITGASESVGVSGVYWGLAGSVGTQSQKGYRWHKGVFGGSKGVLGPL